MVSWWSSWFSRCKFGLLGVYTTVKICHHFLWQPSKVDYESTSKPKLLSNFEKEPLFIILFTKLKALLDCGFLRCVFWTFNWLDVGTCFGILTKLMNCSTTITWEQKFTYRYVEGLGSLSTLFTLGLWSIFEGSSSPLSRFCGGWRILHACFLYLWLLPMLTPHHHFGTCSMFPTWHH